MVELVVEDGTGVAGANSYASLAYADEYFSYHPYYAESWAAITPDTKRQNLLIAATRDLDALLRWQGVPVSTTQMLGWPRYGAVTVDGDPMLSTVIPERLKQATCEQAMFLSRASNNPDTQTGGEIEELKIDVIQLKFASSSVSAPVAVAVARLLRGLGGAHFASRVRRVQVDLA